MMHLFVLTVAVEEISAAEALDVFTPRMPRATAKPAPTVSRRIVLT
jgi:hypothetical protein